MPNPSIPAAKEKACPARSYIPRAPAKKSFTIVVVKKIWQLIVRHKAIFALATVLVYVAGAQLLYQQNKPKVIATRASTIDTFKYNCTDPNSENLICLQKQYQTLTKTEGVMAAFTHLKEQYQTDDNVKADCHQLTHVIGRTEADLVSNVDQAYALGDNFCWSGYYHGVMESIVSRIGAGALPERIPTICAQIKAQKPYSFYHYNCVHGLGHGVMDITYGNLFTALKMCDRLTDNWESQSCYGGVFMQNVMNELDSDHGKPLFKADDPMYPCTAVGDGYKEQCYLMQTSHALHSANGDFATVFAECDKVEAKFRDTCYQSLGRDASGNSNSTVSQTKATCLLGKSLDARENCVIGAVKDFVSYYHSDKQATQFCMALPENIRQTCRTTKIEYYATF